MTRFPLLSVGHSNHSLEQFLALLQAAGVTALADVRSSPFSRRHPQFNGPELAVALRAAQIAYVFLGDQLGGRPRSGDLYDEDGRVDYELVRATPTFQGGLARLLHGAEQYCIAMMCGEEDPLDCHRGLMIAPALVEHGVQPGHLRKDGEIETMTEMETRLLHETGRNAGVLDGLFREQLNEEDRRAELAEAYRCLARKKAFHRPPEEE